MAYIYSRTEFNQALRSFTGLDIGTGHGIALVKHDLGNAAHSGTANADKMQATDTAHFRYFNQAGALGLVAHSVMASHTFGGNQRRGFGLGQGAGNGRHVQQTIALQ